MDEFKVLLIPKNEVANVWQYAKGFIEKSLDESCGEVSLEEVYEDCISGERNLWLVITPNYKVVCGLVTRFIEHPKKKIIQLNYVSGFGFEDYEALLMNTVDRWASKRGAVEVEIVGRKGWERRFKKYNFSHAYSILRKSI